MACLGRTELTGFVLKPEHLPPYDLNYSLEVRGVLFVSLLLWFMVVYSVAVVWRGNPAFAHIFQAESALVARAEELVLSEGPQGCSMLFSMKMPLCQ